MVQLRRHAGQPSLRELERRAGPGWLPRSTLHAVLQGRSFPSRAHLLAFVAACGLPARNVRAWMLAWDRALDAQRAGRPDGLAVVGSDRFAAGEDVFRRVLEAKFQRDPPHRVITRFLQAEG